MNATHLISTVAESWSQESQPPSADPLAGTVCGRCSESDLVVGSRAALLPHAHLHRLVAPIEEILDQAVEHYVQGGHADETTTREQRLVSVDSFRDALRSSARTVVDRALERGIGAVA